MLEQLQFSSVPEILIVTSVGDSHLTEWLVWSCVWWCLPWGLKARRREVLAEFPLVPRTMEKPDPKGKTSHGCPSYDRCWFPLGQGKWEGREGGAGQKQLRGHTERSSRSKFQESWQHTLTKPLEAVCVNVLKGHSVEPGGCLVTASWANPWLSPSEKSHLRSHP